MTLPADKLVKVAEACTGLMYSIHEDEEFGSLILRGPVYPGAEVDLMDEWDPSGDDFKALAQAAGQIGIDPGFKDLITTSDGQKVGHPKELHLLADRLAQAQRGRNRQLIAGIQQRIKNQRKDRNHKLSLRLVQENEFIAFSKDNNKGLARSFGKSVASSAHYQLRQMLAYKSRAGGTQYVEVDSRNSTKTCSACGALSGPTGYAGLKVRQWVCSACGAEHDRDINAAINTLIAGAGAAHEGYANNVRNSKTRNAQASQ